jgi:acetamidase/formamidase
MAAARPVDLLRRRHDLSAMDAYLLCSVRADFVINALVNKPVHVVSLYFPHLVLE